MNFDVDQLCPYFFWFPFSILFWPGTKKKKIKKKNLKKIKITYLGIRLQIAHALHTKPPL